MRIFMACPAPPRSRKGNRVTAVRWARLLRELGHRVCIEQEYRGQNCDMLIALHARKSYPAVRTYRRLHPQGPLVVALTGTDLYHDLATSRRALRSLELADRLVVLQPLARDALPVQARARARTIIQSTVPLRDKPARNSRFFTVCVLGHLRQVKDPFRAARALRFLPPDSRIRIIHAGAAQSPAFAARARALMAHEPRYRWLGEVSARRARLLLARSRLMVLSSRLEGGANVISEAITDDTPVLASKIPGSIGLLGEDYPGYFSVGDTMQLARFLRRAETDEDYYAHLQRACRRLQPLVKPHRERQAWRQLLAELVKSPKGGV